MSETLAIVIGVVGLILTVMNIIDRAYVLKQRAHEPERQQEARIRELEEQCRKFAIYLDTDKRRIDELEALATMNLKCQFALLSYDLNGNDLQKLKDIQEELQDYLTHKGVRV